MSRIARLADSLDEPLLVTDRVNVQYLLGFQSSNCAVLVDPDGTSTLYTDFRYLESARAIAGVEVVQTRRDVAAGLSELLAGRRIGFEASRISYAHWQTLAAGGADLVPTRGLVEAFRLVKDDGEIDAIRRAASISDDVYAALSEERFTGRTEKELAWWIERTFRELGADGLAFAPIVASGLNGASPHAHPGDTVIDEGVLVTIDMGCTIDAYCSDCTRTFAVGEVSEQLVGLYALVAQAQLDGLAAVRAGETGVDVDAASRTAIAAAGMADYYGHGLGHGLGLEVHEAPVLRPESTDVLAPRNLVTIEPGLYLPGVGGCRIEDLVVITETGCEILTSFTKDMLVVG
ncbi:Xaa-Pro peptidase family protein [Gaiella sp.]|uniref:M24 family metallopeptidase n=1 Tax=Gaiella sp. TaxID=2663207 RepID=UPI00326544BD